MTSIYRSVHPSVRLPVLLLCYLLLNQIWREIQSHEWDIQLHIYFDPCSLGGVKMSNIITFQFYDVQVFLHQTSFVFSQIKYIK